MPRLTDLLDCTNRVHCATCRDPDGGYDWRNSVARAAGIDDPDFECPFGRDWEARKAGRGCEGCRGL